MVKSKDNLTGDMSPKEAAQLFGRILAALEKDKPNRLMDIICALVLSLATTCSAWCAYESTLWSGVQTFRLAGANKEGRESTGAAFRALEFRAFDASMFISYMEAKNEGNERQEKFLFQRFRPEMKKALDAWLKSDPFNNPQSPLTPFKMAEYAQPDLLEANHHEEKAAQEYAFAQQANRNSDTYVLLTVLFATVLFFGGIAGTVDSRPLRVSILSVSLLLFLATVAFLGTMPVCKE